MFQDFDESVSILSEAAARTLTRRRVLTTAVKGMVAAAAGVALSSGPNLKQAFAVTCTCNWLPVFYSGGYQTGNSPGNANCPNQGGAASCANSGSGCPSSCTVCTNATTCNQNGGIQCGYQYGQWTSCSGLGTCGNGWRVCTDCKCPDCSSLCTCLSSCGCCNCCHPAEVEAEMRRISEARRAALMLVH